MALANGDQFSGARPASLEFAAYFVPTAGGTLTGVGVGVVTGGATSTLRFGLRAYNPATGLPGALIQDFGTVASTAAGFTSITVSRGLTGGTPYVLTIAQQGGTAPSLTNAGSRSGPWAMTTPTLGGHIQSAAAGALPANGTWVSSGSNAPALWVRFA